MRSLCSFLAVLVSIPAVAGDREPLRAPYPFSEAEILKLVGNLNGNQFRVRMGAFKQLLAIGLPAKPALKDHLIGEASEESRKLAQRLLVSIEEAELARSAFRLQRILDEASQLVADKKHDTKRLKLLLERLIVILDRAVGQKGKHRLPVTFAALRKAKAAPQLPGIVGRRIAMRQNELIIGEANPGYVQNCIVISNSAVTVSSVRNSIIIAPLAVQCSSVRDSLIISGMKLRCSSVRTSTILAGGDAQLSYNQTSTIGVAGKFTVSSSIARGGNIYVNCKPPANRALAGRGIIIGGPAGRIAGDKTVTYHGLVLRTDPPRNHLSGKLSVIATGNYRGQQFAHITLPDGSGPYVAYQGQPILDPKKKPLAGIAGWKLSGISTDYVVFANGKKSAFVPVK